jgi:hypothetical protein
MNKTVKTLLAEYHLLLLNNRLTQLSGSSGDEVIDLSDKINAIKANGIELKGEKKSWIRIYLNQEVIGIPKLLKEDNKIVGIALQIGNKQIKGVGSLPLYFTYINYNGKDSFKITETPATFVTTIGNFPKEIIYPELYMAISSSLTHLLNSDGYKLMYEKWDNVIDGVNGTIRTSPENNWVATVLVNNTLRFDSNDSNIKSLDINIIDDLWKRGMIHKKEIINTNK